MILWGFSSLDEKVMRESFSIMALKSIVNLLYLL